MFGGRQRELEEKVDELEAQVRELRERGVSYHRERRSEFEVFGVPFLHIHQGIDPLTKKPAVARGMIAIGDRATGVIAIGGAAQGLLAIGGFAFGGIAIGGCAIGLAALGGAAFGGLAIGGGAIGYIAFGGGALGHYAAGGGAVGAHTITASQTDPEAVRFFKNFFGEWFTNLLANSR
jgi:hypothetical protein